MTDEGWVQPIEDVMPRMIGRVRTLWDQGKQFPGLPTGLTDVDWMLGGLDPGTLVVMGGPRGPALDAWITTLVLATAAGGAPILYVTSGESGIDLVRQWTTARAHIEPSKTWSGRLSSEDWQRLEQAAADLASSRIWTSDQPTPQLANIVSASETVFAGTPGPGILIVDHLTDVHARSGSDAEDSMGELLAMAGRHDITVVSVEWTRGSVEVRDDHRPLVADLPCAELLAANAAAIVLLYDDSDWHLDSPDRGTVELRVAMNRHGPTGSLRVAHLRDLGLVANMARE